MSLEGISLDQYENDDIFAKQQPISLWDGRVVEKLDGESNRDILTALSMKHQPTNTLAHRKDSITPKMGRPSEGGGKIVGGVDEDGSFYVEGEISWKWGGSDKKESSSSKGDNANNESDNKKDIDTRDRDHDKGN